MFIADRIQEGNALWLWKRDCLSKQFLEYIELTRVEVCCGCAIAVRS